MQALILAANGRKNNIDIAFAIVKTILILLLREKKPIIIPEKPMELE
jgi:hypothetical protein